MRTLGRILNFLGMGMIAVGGLLMASALFSRMIGGRFEAFWEPYMDVVRAVADVFPPLIWPFWLASFIGPGVLVYTAGNLMRERAGDSV